MKSKDAPSISKTGNCSNRVNLPGILSHLSRFHPTFWRYCAIGVINTLAGFGTIYACMYFFSFSPELSNFLGYLLGINVSFLLNKYYNFKSRARLWQEAPLFYLVMALSYLLNFLALKILLFLHLNPYLAQAGAGVIYTLSSYLACKCYVFKQAK
jgi:putative flippase GtrA